jgi:hypothetical protein
MDDINDFLKVFQPKLLRYLDGKMPSSPDESGPLEFVEEVLDAWSNFAKGRKLANPNPLERTFWFSLYQLEELVENPVTDRVDPYEALLMQNLAVARELLREWGELPDGLYATRPGE